MKTNTHSLVIVLAIAAILANGCAQNSTPASTPQPPTAIPTSTPPPEPPPDEQSPPPPQDLPDNHIGVHFEGFDRYSDTQHVYSNGFRWIRIQSLTEFWGDGDGLLTFNLESIPPSADEIISDYVDQGVNIVLDLWMGAGLRPYGTTFQNQEEIDRYLDYVRFVVPHFRGRIRHYQIWNEPGDMLPSDYANLIRQVVPVIREEDPEAKIIIGGMQGNWDDGYPGYGNYQRFSVDRVYLDELLQSGVVHMVDGISWHPFYDNIPDDPYYQNYPQMVREIKDLAASQGFAGEYFADELLWRTESEEGWAGGPPVSPIVGAKYYVRAIVMHRGMDVNVTINTFFQQDAMAPIRNISIAMAGAEPTDLTLTLETDADNVVDYTFELPDGDRLVALWTNGEAVEDDPGASTTLTIAGASAQSVVRVDVLDGSEQELVFETENGSLVIRDLLVKDYPIILRLIG